MTERTGRWWQSRSNIAFAVFLAMGGYFLWTEHSAHITEFLPWILVLGCLGMHLFMHRSHGHGSQRNDHSRASGPPNDGSADR